MSINSQELPGAAVIAFMKDGIIQKVISTEPTQFILLEEASGEAGAENHIKIDGTTYHVWTDDNAAVSSMEVLEIKRTMLEQDIGELTEEDFKTFNSQFHVKAHAMGLAYLIVDKDTLKYENEEMYGHDKYLIIESKIPGQRISFRIEHQESELKQSDYIIRYFIFLARHFGYDSFALKEYFTKNDFPSSSIESLITVTGS